jgi:hypothetical protein
VNQKNKSSRTRFSIKDITKRIKLPSFSGKSYVKLEKSEFCVYSFFMIVVLMIAFGGIGCLLALVCRAFK